MSTIDSSRFASALGAGSNRVVYSNARSRREIRAEQLTWIALASLGALLAIGFLYNFKSGFIYVAKRRYIPMDDYLQLSFYMLVGGAVSLCCIAASTYKLAENELNNGRTILWSQNEKISPHKRTFFHTPGVCSERIIEMRSLGDLSADVLSRGTSDMYQEMQDLSSGDRSTQD